MKTEDFYKFLLMVIIRLIIILLLLIFFFGYGKAQTKDTLPILEKGGYKYLVIEYRKYKLHKHTKQKGGFFVKDSKREVFVHNEYDLLHLRKNYYLLPLDKKYSL